MSVPELQEDDITLAIQFVIPQEFLDVAKKLGVFDGWDERELFTEVCHLEDGTDRVLLTVCGPAQHILHIQRDRRTDCRSSTATLLLEACGADHSLGCTLVAR